MVLWAPNVELPLEELALHFLSSSRAPQRLLHAWELTSLTNYSAILKVLGHTVNDCYPSLLSCLGRKLCDAKLCSPDNYHGAC